MSFESIKADIAGLLDQLSEQPHDRQEIEFLLQERLGELRAFGMPLPQDLVDLAAAIDRQLTAEARQGTRHDASLVGQRRSRISGSGS